MLIARMFKGKKGKVPVGLQEERKRLQGSWLASPLRGPCLQQLYFVMTLCREAH